jgi:glutamate-1-semialdehyde 2,1-aminomutase
MSSRIERPRSTAAFRRAQKTIPGGVNSPARAFGAVGGHPLFITRADGPFLYDLDGHTYVDYIGSWGPMILGHRFPRVTLAVIAALENGSSYGAPTERESELAELIVSAVPSIEQVRMVSSGTEAAMSAVRVARGFTGRDVIVKFAGCYHGHVDALLVQAGSGALTHGVPNSPGVPARCTADTLVLQFNDLAGLQTAFAQHGDHIAGVMLEPVVGNMGLVVPTQEFLRELRRLTHYHGALLIFDEVMTGFRLAWGGAQELFGIVPDMTALGKIVGGGLPVGAYGGRADVMQKVSPAGPIYQAGTLSGNPLAMAAGLATLRELQETRPYAQLAATTYRLCVGLSEAATAAGLPHQLNQVGSMWTLFFTGTPVVDYASACTSDTRRFGRFFWGMMDRGIYLPCSQFEAAFVSTTHTDELINQTIRAAQETFAEWA